MIIGAGPAGLAAGWRCRELGAMPPILESSDRVGGISTTVWHNGYGFDLGGHRFHTKNARVSKLWHEIMGDEMLTRQRVSRIHYRDRFYKYPLDPWDVLRGLKWEVLPILYDYVRAQMHQAPDDSFEDWVVNRFGRRLYETFFRSYTEKVWGIPCSRIDASWASQRIKGLDLKTAALNAFGVGRTPKTLIDEFEYPPRGPGQLYERMAKGLDVRFGYTVVSVGHDNKRVVSVSVARPDGFVTATPVDFVISSMPYHKLVLMMHPPTHVRRAAEHLRYRSLFVVNLLLDRELFPDNWIYVHDPGVKIGRIQNPARWSPHLVPENTKWHPLSVEYFCDPDETLRQSTGATNWLGNALCDLHALGFGRPKVGGCWTEWVPDAYPIYDRGYAERIATLREWTDGFENLFPVGRGGMHRYNNMDHSVLTGLLAAENALESADHDIWAVNADDEYQE